MSNIRSDFTESECSSNYEKLRKSANSKSFRSRQKQIMKDFMQTSKTDRRTQYRLKMSEVIHSFDNDCDIKSTTTDDSCNLEMNTYLDVDSVLVDNVFTGYPDQDSSFESNSDIDDSNLFKNINQTNSLYNGSNISIADFALSFLILCKRINISANAKDILLDYISSILPSENLVPSTYKMLIKNLSLNKYETKTICPICFLDNCHCQNSENRKPVKVYEFDVKNQIKSIVKKNWLTICSYKGILIIIYEIF